MTKHKADPLCPECLLPRVSDWLGLLQDAVTVQAVMKKLTLAGFTGDVFTALNRKCPDWTRERWDRATQELADHQQQKRKSPISTVGEMIKSGALDGGEGESIENFLAA